MVKRVVIVGAGPSGVLLAHYLLCRDDQYYVELYERLSDPQTVPFSKSRTYPLVVNQRGMTALSKVEGIFAAVKAVSLECTGSLNHQKNGKTQFIPRQKPILILDRLRLVVTLLKILRKQYNSDRFNIHFNHECKQINFEAKTVTFENTALNSIREVTVGYDLLIGADGVQSRVREQFLSTNQFELEKKYVLSAYKSIFLSAENATSLKAGYIHTWRGQDGISAILAHDVDGLMS